MKILYLKPINSNIFGKNTLLMQNIANIGELSVIDDDGTMPIDERCKLIREYDVLLTAWESSPVPIEIAKESGDLKYICNMTGSVKPFIPLEIIESPNILVTNWGNSPSYYVAEGAVALLFALLKIIPKYIKSAQSRSGELPIREWQGSLYNMNVGIYGMGMIGAKFAEMIAPFRPNMYAFDPYVDEFPSCVKRCNTLDDLFDKCPIIVVHAGLTDETEGTITKELLQKLPDGGIIINTARSKIINEQDLEKELISGRLRAGIDVAHPNDNLPPVDSPLLELENAIFTGHHVGGGGWQNFGCKYGGLDDICLDNLKKFANGKELSFIIDPIKYSRST